jgi:hypothetical protein
VTLFGVQTPRILLAPAATDDTSWADDCIELAASAGLILDPWQRLALKYALSTRPNDTWAAFEVALIVSRQNGKNGILEARQLAGLFLFGERLQLHTSNKFNSSIEAFVRIRELITNCDALRKRVKRMPTSHGDEGIELFGRAKGGGDTGARLKFMARGPGSGRGFSGDTIYFDEAYNLDTGDVAAMLPTMSAKSMTGNPQLWYTSSAGWEISTQLGDVRKRGIEGESTRLAFMEWSVDEHDFDPDNREGWAQANPALGIRISEDHIAAERDAMRSDPERFARERLGVGSYPAGAETWSVIPRKVWDELTTEAVMLDPVVFALDVTPDRSRTSIAACGADTDGHPLVELIAHGGGTSWSTDRLRDLIEAHPRSRGVVVSPRGPAGSLLPEIRDMLDGIRKDKLLITPSAMDEAQACSGLYDAATDSMSLRHRGQAPIATALAGARQKNLSEGAWTWNRKSVTVDISPLWAITLAKWGHETAPKRRTPFILVGSAADTIPGVSPW